MAEKAKTSVVTFDWKGHPEPEDIERALQEIGIPVSIQAANTGSDEYGYVFSIEELDGDEAQAGWEAYLQAQREEWGE